jgi:hypothetical protein
MALRRRPLTTCVFVANITGEFIPVLDIPHAHDAFVDLGRHVLRLGIEEEPRNSTVFTFL